LHIWQLSNKKYCLNILEFQEKKKIAEKALTFIKENEHYFLDVSATISYLAKKLNSKVTIFTHSLDNIEILSGNQEVSVHSIAGCLNKENLCKTI
jgi:Transcriptional regulators of sugar metabolism